MVYNILKVNINDKLGKYKKYIQVNISDKLGFFISQSCKQII